MKYRIRFFLCLMILPVVGYVSYAQGVKHGQAADVSGIEAKVGFEKLAVNMGLELPK